MVCYKSVCVMWTAMDQIRAVGSVISGINKEIGAIWYTQGIYLYMYGSYILYSTVMTRH